MSLTHPIEVDAVPEEYRITINGDQITVWDGRGNGKKHDLADLVPWADED